MITPQAPPRPPPRPMPMRGPAAMMSAGMPAEKSMDFWPSAKRLLRRLAPEKVPAVTVVGLTVAGVSFSVIGPKILGHATNLIFAGVIGQRLPPGITQQQAIDAARARGQGSFADLLSGMTVIPGQGVDFGALSHVLLIVLCLYIAASALMWVQAYVLNPSPWSA